MGDHKEHLKRIFARPIHLAEQVIEWTKEDNISLGDEIRYLIKLDTEKLLSLLNRLMGNTASICYDRPVREIMSRVEKNLNSILVREPQVPAHDDTPTNQRRRNWQQLTQTTLYPPLPFLFQRSRHGRLDDSLRYNFDMDLDRLRQQALDQNRRRAAGGASDTPLSKLHDSVQVVTWLASLICPATDQRQRVRCKTPKVDDRCRIWEQIVKLCNGSLAERGHAARSLLLLGVEGGVLGRKMIIEEGGIPPLLKLLKEGCTSNQVNAVKALGSLGQDSESVQRLISGGVVPVFVKILKEGPMEVQAEVAWFVSEFVAVDPKCQEAFAQQHVIRSLVCQLALETIEEQFGDVIVINKATSVCTIVMARYQRNTGKVIDDDEDDDKHDNDQSPSQQQKHSLSASASFKARNEEPYVKNRMKAMAALALGNLANGNSSICRIIIETRALTCLAILLENGEDYVQYNSAMALMKITAVAEQDADLRRSAFKASSHAYKAIVNQLVRIIGTAETNSTLLIPCIKAIGNLARTFRVIETRIIIPLVRLLDPRKGDVCKEALIALTKFVCQENFLHQDHSKVILSAGGAKNLVFLGQSPDKIVQNLALTLLCYIALDVPGIKDAQTSALLALNFTASGELTSVRTKQSKLWHRKLKVDSASELIPSLINAAI